MRPQKLFSLILAAVFLTSTLAVYAQTTAAGPQVVITWKVVGGAAPSGYAGKILPTTGSQVEASVAVLSGGKFIPLGSQTIYWYLDDNLIGGGTGQQSITFNAPDNVEIMSLRAEIPDYQSGLLNTAYIRMVSPQVIIVAPYPNGTFSSSTVSLEAVPYFFNAPDIGKLSFQWTVNGQAVATQENPQKLTVNLSGGAPAGYSLAINLAVQESGNPFLSIRRSITLTQSNQ
jgi:hypothetical protein